MILQGQGAVPMADAHRILCATFLRSLQFYRILIRGERATKLEEPSSTPPSRCCVHNKVQILWLDKFRPHKLFWSQFNRPHKIAIFLFSIFPLITSRIPNLRALLLQTHVSLNFNRLIFKNLQFSWTTQLVFSIFLYWVVPNFLINIFLG